MYAFMMLAAMNGKIKCSLAQKKYVEYACKPVNWTFIGVGTA